MITLGILTTILIISILVICGDRGTKSIVTTIIQGFILLSSIFGIHHGLHPVATTIFSCILITIFTLYYQNEGGIKSKISLISVLTIILITVPMVYWFSYYSNSYGIPHEAYEITDSNGYTRNIGIPMIYLQISVMFIGLVGILVDTSVAITSSIYEIYENNNDLTTEELIYSSLTVGKSILATSIHTIFYIYIAEYLTLLIQYFTDYSLVYIINSLSFSKELIAISISGIGCALIVPVTAILGSILIKKYFSSHKIKNTL